MFIIPIKKNGNVLGSLICSYDIKNLNELLEPSFNGYGQIVITDILGNVITQTKNGNKYEIDNNSNLINMLKKDATFIKYDNYEELLSKSETKKGGYSMFELNNEKLLCHYCSIDKYNWNMYIFVPVSIISKNLPPIADIIKILSLIITLCFTMFIVYIYHINYKSQKNKNKYIKSLEQLAYIDDLTNARNFTKFKIDAQHMLEKESNKLHMMIKFDIDNFKLINQLHGFDNGDKILISIAKICQKELDGGAGIFARVSADEFVIFRNYIPDRQFRSTYYSLINKIGKDLDFEMNNRIKVPTGCYVIKPYKEEKQDISKIYELTNFAHSRVKQGGKSDFLYYSDSITDNALYKNEIESKMEYAYITEQFKLYLQPKYNLANQ